MLQKRLGDKTEEHLAKWKIADNSTSNEEKKADVGMWLVRAEEGGKTWSAPHGIGVSGYPSHLVRLKDDTLLMTYSFRKEPCSIRGKTSEDNGQTWSEEFRITEDSPTWEYGLSQHRPTKDGSLVTVWYEVRPNSPNAVIRQARWNLK